VSGILGKRWRWRCGILERKGTLDKVTYEANIQIVS
jgi:hypothetical protein